MQSIAPGALDDPEKALRDLIPRLRFLVVEPVEKPTVRQSEELRVIDWGSSLVQIRKALHAGALRIGPLPVEVAERSMTPPFLEVGVPASLRDLTDSEKAQKLRCIDDEAG